MAAVVAVCVFSLAGATAVWAQAQDAQGEGTRKAPIGAGNTFVTAEFDGSIFGFDIDQNGTEGVLSEGQTIVGGNTLAAVETPIAPAKPSQVLPGLMRGIILCLPMRDPTA